MLHEDLEDKLSMSPSINIDQGPAESSMKLPVGVPSLQLRYIGVKSIYIIMNPIHLFLHMMRSGYVL